MGDYLKLIDAGAELAGLKDELDLIEALADTAQKWELVASKIDGATTLEKFLDTLARDISGDQVKQAFGLAGLGEAHATLARLMGKLTAGADKIPDQVKTLFNPLSTFANGSSGVVEWKLSGKEEAELGKDVKLGIQGGGALRFEAAAKAKIGETELDRLLRLGASLNAKATAAGTLPIRWGTIGGAGEASVDVALDYYYRPADAASFYGVALAERIVNLPDPFDYGSVWDAFQSPLGLQGIVYSFTDKASAKVDLAVSASGSLTKDILADVELTFGATASTDNRFLLSLRAVEEGAVRKIEAVLSRARTNEAGASVGIGLTVDLSTPFARVREVLNRAITKSNAVIGKIAPYLKPGTLLRTGVTDLVEEKAKRLIADEDLRKALLADIATATGKPPADESALVGWLTAKLTDEIDARAKDLTDLSAGATDRMIANVLAGLPAPLRDQAGDKVKAELKPLIDQVAEQFKKTVGDLVALPGGALHEALEEIGATVGAQVDRLDKAMEPVRKLIDRYNDLLKKAKSFADDAARAKVTASVTLEELWKWGAEEKIVGIFGARSMAAAKLFDQISRGAVEDVRKLLLDGSPTDDFDLTEAKSLLKRKAQRTSKSKVEIVLFGFGTTGTVALDGKAEMTIDGNGDIQVDAEGKLDKRFKGRGEGRELTLVDTFSLRLAKAAAGTIAAERRIESGVSIADTDASLKLTELTGFVRSLGKVGLVTARAEDLATKQFQAWSAGAEAIAADVGAKLLLTHDQAKVLMMLDQRDKNRLNQAAALKVINCGIAALTEADARNMSQIKVALNKFFLAWGLDPMPLPHLIYAILYTEPTNSPIALPRLVDEYIDKKPNADMRVLISEMRYMEALTGLIEEMGSIYLATPNIAAGGKEQWSEWDYAAAEHRIACHGGRWLYTGGGLFRMSPEVARSTIAFLIAFCDLAGIPRAKPGTAVPAGGDAMALTLSRRTDPDRIAETVTLTQAA